MNWETYKQLTKEEREEYNYRFKDEDGLVFGANWYLILIFGFLIIILLLTLISLQTKDTTMNLAQLGYTFKFLIAFGLATDITYTVLCVIKKQKWVKQHLKVVHK